MSVNSELSALLTKMGGTPLESDSNSDLIKKISSAYEGGGSGSGGGVTIVHVNLDAQGTGALDMTAGEIMAAAQTGPVVIIESADGFGAIGVGPAAIIRQAGAYMVESGSHMLYEAANANDYPAKMD